MKTNASPTLLSRTVRIAGFTLVLAALSSLPAIAQDPTTGAAKAGDRAANKADDKITDYRSDSSELNKAEVKAALAQVDAELEHLDRLADNAPTEAEKTAAKARYAALKERRDELQKNFNRARYEAFKADVRAEKDKAAAWTKETFSTKPKASGAARDVSDQLDTSAEKISDYRADANDTNKAEVKAALARLDVDIQLLESRINTISDPQRKAELTERLRGYKERREELNKDFRQARFQALVDDVKADWDRITK